MNLAIRKEALTEEQMTLIEQAGAATGIPVTSRGPEIIIKDLSAEQCDQLERGFREHWHIGQKNK